MSFNEKMTAIADAIRDKTGETEKLGLDAMVDGVNNVYDLGKQAECDRFWDAFQQNGNRKNWTYAFYGSSSWTDEVYNPKYPFVIKTGANQMFYQTGLTNIKVPIDLTQVENTNHVNLFGYSKALVTIPKIIVNDTNYLTGDFDNCTALKNITFEGTIGRDINLQWSPLTPESAWNVVQHLKYFDMDSTDFMKYTVTFSAAVWEALDEYTRENELHGWGFVKDYIENDIGWKTA